MINTFWIDVKGHSMYPTIKNGERVMVEEVDQSELSLGDIVLFIDQHSREITLHRLIEFPFKTKGDFSILSEENSPNFYLGRATLLNSGKKVIELNRFKKLFLKLSAMGSCGKFQRQLAMKVFLLASYANRVCNGKTIASHNRLRSVAGPS